ncbi:unnamed protein product, partial [Phaeothamnion confervicola]
GTLQGSSLFVWGLPANAAPEDVKTAVAEFSGNAPCHVTLLARRGDGEGPHDPFVLCAGEEGGTSGSGRNGSGGADCSAGGDDSGSPAAVVAYNSLRWGRTVAYVTFASTAAAAGVLRACAAAAVVDSVVAADGSSSAAAGSSGAAFGGRLCIGGVAVGLRRAFPARAIDATEPALPVPAWQPLRPAGAHGASSVDGATPASRPSTLRPPPLPLPLEAVVRRKVLVAGLRADVTRPQLDSAFKRFGAIERSMVRRRPGAYPAAMEGWVIFEAKTAAKAATKCPAGELGLGEAVTVSFAPAPEALPTRIGRPPRPVIFMKPV